jgi:hypothetical protein
MPVEVIRRSSQALKNLAHEAAQSKLAGGIKELLMLFQPLES